MAEKLVRKQYLLLEFRKVSEEDLDVVEVQIVPQSWIEVFEHGQELITTVRCWWPSYRGNNVPFDWIVRGKLPDKDRWEKFPAIFLYQSSKFNCSTL